MNNSKQNLNQGIGGFIIGLLSGVNSLRVSLCAIFVFLTGCAASTITIDGDYPTPLVNKLPITLGVYYSEELSDFTYIEFDDRTGKDQYIVNSGPSQVELFNTILPALFQEVVVITDINSVADYPDLDVVFVPAIEEFQVGLPEKTRLDVYEIWIKYNMRLSRANGDNIADWVMTAYGKSPTETFHSVGSGVNDAAIVALRDLAASFALGFEGIPEVNEWLVAHNNGTLD